MMKLGRMPQKFRGWTTTTMLHRFFVPRARDGLLGMMVGSGPRGFLVMAVATTADISGKNAIESVEKFFENHAHDVIGERKTLAGAKALAERYAETWLAGQKGIAPCPCDEIKPRAKTKRAA